MMGGKKLIFLILFTIIFSNICFINAAECGSVPVRGCTVSVDTTFDSGNYALNGTSTSDPMITVSGSNIRLDCNNALFYGNYSGYGRGIYVNQVQNVTILNCNLEGYFRGVYIRGFSKNITLDNFKVYNTSTAVYIDHSNNTHVINSNITFSSKGIYALNTSKISVNTTLFQQNNYSIFLENSSEGIIYRNNLSNGLRVTGNSFAEIIISNGNFTQISNNFINNGSYRGIYLDNHAEHSEIFGNFINDSYYDGIAMYSGSDYNEIYTNNITNSVNNGISMRSSNSHFYNNVIAKNFHHGMDLRGDVYTFGVENNVIENNFFYDQEESHFIYMTQASNNTIQNNQFINQSGASNIQDGIQIANESNGNRIIGNTFVNIFRYGVQFIWGTRDNLVKDNNFSQSIKNYTYFFSNSTNDSIRLLGKDYYINTTEKFDGWINESNSQINNTDGVSHDINLYGLTNAKITYGNGSIVQKTGTAQITLLSKGFFWIIDKFYSTEEPSLPIGSTTISGGEGYTKKINITKVNESDIVDGSSTNNSNDLENNISETTNSTDLGDTGNEKITEKVFSWAKKNFLLVVGIVLIILIFLKIKGKIKSQQHL